MQPCRDYATADAFIPQPPNKGRFKLTHHGRRMDGTADTSRPFSFRPQGQGLWGLRPLARPHPDTEKGPALRTRRRVFSSEPLIVAAGARSAPRPSSAAQTLIGCPGAMCRVGLAPSASQPRLGPSLLRGIRALYQLAPLGSGQQGSCPLPSPNDTEPVMPDQKDQKEQQEKELVHVSGNFDPFCMVMRRAAFQCRSSERARPGSG